MILGRWDTIRRREYVIEPMDVSDAASASALHGAAFSRAWSDGEILDLLKQEGVFGYLARRSGVPQAAPGGFVLARCVLDEAEILTICVDPRLRRRGIGHRLMDAVLRRLHGERTKMLFLEVDQANEAARALYERFGFRQVGARPGYYREGPARSGALVMRRDLG